MKRLLQGSDYNWIEETATDLIEDLGLKWFPVSEFEVAHLLGIEVRKYSELSREDRAFVISKNPLGCSKRLGNKYIIWYNDFKPRRMIRFTIWHEIAHIQLGHIEGDCTKNDERLEQEANHFAAYVLAPLAFVHQLGLNSPQQIADVCEISLECASNVYANYVRVFQFPSIRRRILGERIIALLSYRQRAVVA